MATLRDHLDILRAGRADPADPQAYLARHRIDATALFNAAGTDQERGFAAKIAAFVARREGRLNDAITWSRRAFDASSDVEALSNLLIVVREARDAEAAADIHVLAKSRIATYTEAEQGLLAGVLCHNLGQFGDLDGAKRFGLMALEIQDRVNRAQPIATPPRPAFDFMRPGRNIIAFSLFGVLPRYTVLAIENARAARHVYPGWTCRYYVDDSVPDEVIEALRGLKAEIVVKPAHDPLRNTGLFWRFEVAADPEVDFFLVRDADSVVNVREKAAVDDFLFHSEARFHVMRDYFSHAELMLAGMWGGIGAGLPEIVDEIAVFQQTTGRRIGQHNQDQLFLRTRIWPKIKHLTLVHDDWFGFAPGGEARRFPGVGRIEPVRHVGQDMSIYLNLPSRS